jgi:hypothetical protein
MVVTLQMMVVHDPLAPVQSTRSQVRSQHREFRATSHRHRQKGKGSNETNANLPYTSGLVLMLKMMKHGCRIVSTSNADVCVL